MTCLITKNFPTEPAKLMPLMALIVICHPDGSGRFLITGGIEALKQNVSQFKNSLAMSGSDMHGIC